MATLTFTIHNPYNYSSFDLLTRRLRNRIQGQQDRAPRRHHPHARTHPRSHLP